MIRPIRLRAQEQEPLFCERFDDPAVVQTYERSMRVHRAHTEAWMLERDDERPDTVWRVSGASGTTWRVDMVDGLAWDSCDCPDFLGNRLSTCKHLEAVRKAVAARGPLKRWMKGIQAAVTPPTAVLTVDCTGTAVLRTLGRWTPAMLRQVGLTANRDGALVVDRAEAVQARNAGKFRVTHAAVAVAAMVARRSALSQRRDDVGGAIDRGRMGLDVLSAPLFPYQVDGVRHLVTAGRAVLADDMGLGKTVQALAACEVLRRRGEASRIVVVTSASLKDQWAREITRYTGERAVVVGGGMAARHEAFESDAPYKVLNYELTWRELARLQRLDADVLVLDEAQRARNFRTRTAATLREIPSRFLCVLTGTPVENKLDDLYALLQLVDPELLGPLWEFNLAYHVQGRTGRIEGYKNLAALRARIASVVLRRRKEEVLTQLPPLTHQTRYTQLSARQASLERRLRTDAMQLMQRAERRPLSREERDRVQMLLLKARQACNALELCDPRLDEKASPKLDEFESLVGEVVSQGTSKVLVFSEWTGMLRLAAARLEAMGVGFALLHGGIATERRPAILDRFRNAPEVRVLLATDAGGVGLNLQVASYVVHLDLPWNPARLDQRTARAHRLGQTRGVSVTYLVAESGIERGIEGTLATKRAVRAAALDLDSDVDAVTATRFTDFLKQLRATLAVLDQDVGDVEGDVPVDTATVTALAVEEAVAAASEGDEITTAWVETTAEGLSEDVHGELPPAEQPMDTVMMESESTARRVELANAALEHAVGPARSVSTEVPAEVPTGVTTDGAGGAAQRTGVGRGGRAHDRLRLARVVLDAGFASDAVQAGYEALRAAVTERFDGRTFDSHAALVGAIYRELIPQGLLAPAAHGVLARLHDLASLDAHGVTVDAALAREAVDEATEWVERLGADT